MGGTALPRKMLRRKGVITPSQQLYLTSPVLRITRCCAAQPARENNKLCCCNRAPKPGLKARRFPCVYSGRTLSTQVPLMQNSSSGHSKPRVCPPFPPLSPLSSIQVFHFRPLESLGKEFYTQTRRQSGGASNPLCGSASEQKHLFSLLSLLSPLPSLYSPLSG